MSVSSDIAAQTVNLGLKYLTKVSPADAETIATGMIAGGETLVYIGQKLKGGLTGEEVDQILADLGKNVPLLMAVAAYIRNIVKF